MKIYNSRLDAVLDIIKISQLNVKEFEEVTGLTRSRLYSWRSGKVKNINTGTAEEIAERLLGFTELGFEEVRCEVQPKTAEAIEAMKGVVALVHAG